MPNNLVFNNVASEMQTQIFGRNGTNVVAILTDTSGNLLVVGTVTVQGGTLNALSAGTVTVQGGTIDVLSAGTVTVQGGTIQEIPVFFSTNTTVGVGTATLDALEVETATKKVYSFYVANIQGTATLTAFLQISPTNANATYYVNDTSSSFTIAAGAQAVLVAAKFLRYTKLRLVSTAATATALVYFDSQS